VKFNNENLCDFCFQPIDSQNTCPHCGLTPDTYQAPDGILVPGTNIMGKYIIGRMLARGGNDATYIAYSSALKKAVAIKEYFPLSFTHRLPGEEKVLLISDDKRELYENGIKRFCEEPRTVSKFKGNPNIMSVYELFYANNTAYYSMEYLEGCNLKCYISQKGGSLSESEVVYIAKAVCDGLVAVHSTQTIHRDIGPDNIFVCKSGDIKIIGFEASKQMTDDEDHMWAVITKEGFASAEQYMKSSDQGVWTDIYSLGATMYYALTEKIPSNAIERLENPELEFEKKSDYNPLIIKIITKCMECKYSDRYQSVLELSFDLKKLADAVGETAIVPTIIQSANNCHDSVEYQQNISDQSVQPSNSKNESKNIYKIKKNLVIACISLVCVVLGTGITAVLLNNENSSVKPVTRSDSAITSAVSEEVQIDSSSESAPVAEDAGEESTGSGESTRQEMIDEANKKINNADKKEIEQKKPQKTTVKKQNPGQTAPQSGSTPNNSVGSGSRMVDDGGYTGGVSDHIDIGDYGGSGNSRGSGDSLIITGGHTDAGETIWYD